MEHLNRENRLQELSNNESKTINGGGPILEGAAWLLGFLNEIYSQDSMRAVNSPITGPRGNKFM